LDHVHFIGDLKEAAAVRIRDIVIVPARKASRSVVTVCYGVAARRTGALKTRLYAGASVL